MANLSVINQRIKASIGDIISGRPDVLADPDPRITGGTFMGPAGQKQSINQYSDMLNALRTPTVRVRELQYYDYLETEIPDVRKALDAYATMAVTGDLAGGGNNTFMIKMVDDDIEYPDQLKELLSDLEILIQRNAYMITRGMAKYGSFTPEIVVDVKDGVPFVKYLKVLPPGTMFRNVKSDGTVDRDKYWIQVINSKIIDPRPGKKRDGAAFTGEFSEMGIEQWRIPHFALWANVVNTTTTLLYGQSILQPVGSIALKVHAMLDASVVARLSRAAMRYVWKVDVSDLLKKGDATEGIQRRMDFWRRSVGRTSSLLDTTAGTHDTHQKAIVPDSDFYVPAAENFAWDLDTLSGDTNLARVGDIELLVRFFFGALGVPPEYLGHQRSQGGRSNLSQVDVMFARMTRHLQMFTATGFEHVAYVAMALAGFDPREYPVRIVPPQIGARDELLQAQVKALQAEVVKSLRVAGMKIELNPKWVLETFMNLDKQLDDLDDETIKNLFLATEGMSGSGLDSPKKDEAKKIREILSTNTSSMMTLIRDNIRMLSGAGDLMPGAYDNMQPTPGELGDAIAEMKAQDGD